MPASYWPQAVDQGVADPTESFRAVLVFPIQNQDALTALVNNMYTPGSPQFRQYLSKQAWLDQYGPTQEAVTAASNWLSSQGLKVGFVADNRLLLEYTGTVGQWNAAFGTQLHRVVREANSRYQSVYAPIGNLMIPQALYGIIKRVLLPDQALVPATLPPDNLPVTKTMPMNVANGIAPAQLAKTYGLSTLYGQGYHGAGMALGIIAGTTFRTSDVQSMWQTFGITRKDPIRVDTMEPQTTRALEATGDVQLAGSLAPDADVYFYSGPDITDTSLVYTFNEAIARNEVQVLSDSFAHSEFDSSASVARTYDEAALIAAAQGITIVSATGDSNQVDMPADSPYVTAVGGTELMIASDGTWQAERSWGGTGCGATEVFAIPAWQNGTVTGTLGCRAIADISIAQGPYWMMYQQMWNMVGGTSCSSAIMAGLLTVINHARSAQGKPALGYLNPIIYQDAASRATFRDVTIMGTSGCSAGPGYDMATGLGSPKAAQMAMDIP